MVIIRNTKLFKELQKESKRTSKERKIWQCLFRENGSTIKDKKIPEFFGMLDHIEVTRYSVYFYDADCNGKTNSFAIRKELK